MNETLCGDICIKKGTKYEKYKEYKKSYKSMSIIEYAKKLKDETREFLYIQVDIKDINNYKLINMDRYFWNNEIKREEQNKKNPLKLYVTNNKTI